MTEQDQITQERIFVTALFDLIDNDHSITLSNADDQVVISINGDIPITFPSIYTEYPGTRLIQAIAESIPKEPK